MATVIAVPPPTRKPSVSSSAGSPDVGLLSLAQAGNGVTTNIVDRGGSNGPVLIQILTSVGATPTCTYAIEGSPDASSWFPVAYADSATPTTVSVATFAITGAGTAWKIVQANVPARYLRITFSANTNVTNTVFVYPRDL